MSTVEPQVSLAIIGEVMLLSRKKIVDDETALSDGPEDEDTSTRESPASSTPQRNT